MLSGYYVDVKLTSVRKKHKSENENIWLGERGF
jgi:hypothetical protein